MSDSQPITRETSPLASIQLIHSPQKIEGRDQIVTATVLGFRVIVKKNDFFPLEENKENPHSTLCIFIQPDSLLDDQNPAFSFLTSKVGRLVYTRKIYGIYSQGLCLPLSEMKFYNVDPQTLQEGMDVTNIMKITKYIPPEETSQYNTNGSMAPFPLHLVPKTNEPSLQMNIKFLSQIQNRRITVTLKLDGSSMTVTSNGKLCGRNFEWLAVDNSNKLYFEADSKFQLREKIKDSGLNVQGELVGPSIQKNPLKLEKIDFFVFNMFSNGKYLSHSKVEQKCQEWSLKMVPCLYNDVETSTLPFKTVEDWLQFADQQVYITSGKPAEGIVVKTSDDLEPRISFKVLSRKYVSM
jgi:RNA ligase (TIGR02306 family)